MARETTHSAQRKTAAILAFALAFGLVSVDSAKAIDPPTVGVTHGVVSGDSRATEAGMRVLRSGGNAADAAFTVAAVLGVVEGWFSSPLGGEVWALRYDGETGETIALDGVGPAGAHATLEFWSDPANNRRAGMHQAVVPGAWDAWMQWLDRYGSKELPELLSPAIGLAENGFRVSPVMHTWIRNELEEIRRWPIAREIFLEDGEIPPAGAVIRFPDMAGTYREIIDAYEAVRSEGRSAAFRAASDYYYRGPIGEKIVAFSKENGGLFEAADFTGYRGAFRDTISIEYKEGIRVFQCPPNSQGIAMLLGLLILRDYDVSRYPMQSADMIHLVAEATKLAMVDKWAYVGDPDVVDVPVDELLSRRWAELQRTRISMDDTLEWPIEPGLELLGSGEYDERDSHTTTYQVVDAWGNGVSVTTSLGANFLVVGDTGIIINNRMRMFSAREGNPNAVAPGKKVRHTSNPYIATKDGKLYIMGGNTGVDSQPQGQIQQFVYAVEYGRDPQDAVSRSRFIVSAFPSSTPPFEAENTLALESGYGERVRDELRRKGHDVAEWAIFGNANMVVVEPDSGRLLFGADPRGMNSALAE